jgi:hypothetical protein
MKYNLIKINEILSHTSFSRNLTKSMAALHFVDSASAIEVSDLAFLSDF